MATKGVLTTNPWGKTTFDPYEAQKYDFMDFTDDGGPDRALHPGLDFGPFSFCFNTTLSTVVGDVIPHPTGSHGSDFELVNHGLLNGDQVRFDTDGITPLGLLLATFYFVVNKDTDFFQVSLTDGGDPITIDNVGVGHLIVLKRGQPFDFTDYQVWAYGKVPGNSDRLVDLNPTFDTAALGVIKIFKAGVESNNVPDAEAKWDLIVADPLGNRLPILVRGRLTVAQAVTHPDYP